VTSSGLNFGDTHLYTPPLVPGVPFPGFESAFISELATIRSNYGVPIIAGEFGVAPVSTDPGFSFNQDYVERMKDQLQLFEDYGIHGAMYWNWDSLGASVVPWVYLQTKPGINLNGGLQWP